MPDLRAALLDALDQLSCPLGHPELSDTYGCSTTWTSIPATWLESTALSSGPTALASNATSGCARPSSTSSWESAPLTLADPVGLAAR
jgi:hypothetical protein